MRGLRADGARILACALNIFWQCRLAMSSGKMFWVFWQDVLVI
jgi:hypothetical protein